MTETLKESKRLYDLGFAIHFLHPKSKRPIESGWTTGPRKDWARLEMSYVEGVNIGVRLGTPSLLTKGYLAVVDVDVKSTDPAHRKEAVAAAVKLLGGVKCPAVMSGRGNGSRHYYCVTGKPFKTWNPAASTEKVKVKMPSKSPSKYEVSHLSTDEITQGIRIANAWEISLYSDGRQVVLPPSIHPDSGEPYRWARPVVDASSLPLIEFPAPTADVLQKKSKKLQNSPVDNTDFVFVEVPVDLSWFEISDKIKEGILHGTNVQDRSGYLLPASTALHSAGLSRDEILTILTDRETFLGACAYDHANTDSRERAAYWVYKYTLRRVLKERSGKGVFQPATEYESAGVLSDKEIQEQTAAILSEKTWEQNLTRTGKDRQGPPQMTIGNVTLILKNKISPGIIKRNEFAFRDSYGCDTPWAKKDENFEDDHVPVIIHWLGQNWNFEPGKDVIYNAMTVIAVENGYDPVKEQLEKLPAWDRKKRLDTWLHDYFGAEGDAEYLAQVFRKWIVAMVMRAYQPGAKFDWMPIFEGLQGVGKSSFGRLLVGDQYFCDWLPSLGDKDSALALLGNWACEMGELSQFRNNELETIKAFIVRTVDKVRPPFGRKVVEMPRRCVFFGTTNRETYLRDATGNRRLKPVKVGALNFEQLKEDRDQLFAEAKWLFENFHETEETLELTGNAKIFEAKIHEEKMVQDDSEVMFMLLQDFIEKEAKKENGFNFEKFRIVDLFQGFHPVGVLSKWNSEMKNVLLAVKALKKLGGETRTIKGRVFWKIPKIDEIWA